MIDQQQIGPRLIIGQQRLLSVLKGLDFGCRLA
jgi:hypothetical protein